MLVGARRKWLGKRRICPALICRSGGGGRINRYAPPMGKTLAVEHFVVSEHYVCVETDGVLLQ